MGIMAGRNYGVLKVLWVWCNGSTITVVVIGGVRFPTPIKQGVATRLQSCRPIFKLI